MSLSQRRISITGNKDDFMKFKVPSLRNVEMTYPYMHDGRFRNLQQVLNHYTTGNFYTDNIDSSIVKIKGLSTTDQANVIIFLKTLTDQTFLHDRRFADPNIK